MFDILPLTAVGEVNCGDTALQPPKSGENLMWNEGRASNIWEKP
jgi:hypothetical protein